MKNGFSLIELMITITILAIVIAFGAPSFSGAIQNSRITSKTNATVGALGYTRSEAVKRNDLNVSICGSSDQASCNTNDWELGWIIFRDINGDGARTVDEELLRIGEPLYGGITLTLEGFQRDTIIEYDSQGQIARSGTLVFCDDRGAEEARAIIINISGKSRIATDDDTPVDSIVNDHNGDDVTCG